VPFYLVAHFEAVKVVKAVTAANTRSTSISKFRYFFQISLKPMNQS